VHAGVHVTALSTEIEKATDERQRWIDLDVDDRTRDVIVAIERGLLPSPTIS